MSLDAITWAFSQRGLKPAPKLVLMRLADQHNKHTGYAEISYKYLCDDCEVSKNTAIKHLEHLIELGLIAKSRQTRKNGGHAFNRYMLAFDHPDIELHGSETEQGASAENEQADSSETEQGASSPSCTRVVQTGEQGKNPLGIKDTPLNPPVGGNPVLDNVLSFKLTEDYAKEIATDVDSDTKFVFWVLERWRSIMRTEVEGGARPRSLAANFKRWLTRHKSLQALKNEWWRSRADSQTNTAAKGHASLGRKQTQTRLELFDTEAGQYALQHGYGARWLDALSGNPDLTTLEETKRSKDEITAAKPEDNARVAEFMRRSCREREEAFSQKYLKVV